MQPIFFNIDCKHLNHRPYNINNHDYILVLIFSSSNTHGIINFAARTIFFDGREKEKILYEYYERKTNTHVQLLGRWPSDNDWHSVFFIPTIHVLLLLRKIAWIRIFQQMSVNHAFSCCIEFWNVKNNDMRMLNIWFV